MPLSEERTVDDTRWTSEICPFGLRFMRAMKRLRYSSRQTLRTLAEERRRFAIINIPRQQFSQATGETARRAAKKIARRA